MLLGRKTTTRKQITMAAIAEVKVTAVGLAAAQIIVAVTVALVTAIALSVSNKGSHYL